MLRRLLNTTPEIADYIRNLEYTISSEDLNTVLLAQTFKKIIRLKSLTVTDWNKFKLQWSNNPLRPALLHLLDLPTLVHFKLSRVQNFLVSDLAPCINLEQFEFVYLHVLEAHNALISNQPDLLIRIHRISAEESYPGTLMKMCMVQCADGTPFIDTSSLANLAVTISRSDDIEASHYLFSRCKNLIDACIQNKVKDEQNWTRIGLAKLLHPSIQTLKHLRMETSQTAIDNPLAGLYTEFQAIQNYNVIETLAIEVKFEPYYRLGDNWVQLIKALTHSGWPKLQQVSLTVAIWSYDELTRELKCALGVLPQIQLSKSFSSKSLSFRFAIREDCKNCTWNNTTRRLTKVYS